MAQSDEGPADTGGETRRIVVGVDGSSGSLGALRWAAREASLRDADLEVVHVRFFRKEVLDLAGLEQDEEQVLERAVALAREEQPGIRVVGRVVDPPPGRALVEASRGADLLVVGSRGLGGFDELTLGSVSQQCSHHARSPVAIIRS